ncbi:MAG: Holliday junction branch migration protein RuvA [Gammaproteobacteria bacterium]|nr:MAG: Holliday junction branch migration protein RuvA [Gammaproteobacteria bacterium]UCH40184.1 MAG: Holliday junction branch migration protein RuvA [Gammaproteobacteria bacterium]
MISRLTGILAAKRAPQVLIDCHGVGYEADVSMTTFYKLPEVGSQVSLWTHLLVREDAHSLIGFHDEQERRLFRQLIRITGVGPKMALTILSGIDEQQFALCVANNDIAMLTRLPGVGKKTAERLIIEMRDKVEATPGELPAQQPAAGGQSVVSEAVEALQALGYKPADAEKMISRAQQQAETGSSASQLIKKALQATVRI